MAKKHKKVSSQKANRSKGDRLGWKSLKDVKSVCLKDIIGEGVVVDVSQHSLLCPRKPIL